MKKTVSQNADRFKIFNQPETITSLAAKYQISRITFRKWIKPIEHKLTISHRRPFTPSELKIIFEFLGEYNPPK